MSRFWSPIVHKLSPYVPGEQPKQNGLVKLNTNENPYGPSPRVIDAIRGELGDGLRLYPDPSASLLRQSVADYYGLKSQQVFAGNGSDEVLAHTFCALFQHDGPLLFPDITYSFYPVYCRLYGINYETVPLTEKFGLQVGDYNRPNGGIILANPNAPTGCLLSLEEIERLLQSNTESVVVVDEAYIDFGGESAVSLIESYPNLLVIQTLSKSRSLAGMRVGLALGSEQLISGLERVKDSFNSYPMDRLAIAAATASFEDEDYFREICQRVMDSREQLAGALLDLGFEMTPSAANFLFVRHPGREASELAAVLREDGVIVRHFKQPRIDQYLRITVGTPEQNGLLLEALAQTL
jgi:histidinol-phosphate aminotransferase